MNLSKNLLCGIIFESLMAVRPVALFITLSQAQSFNIKRQLKKLALTLNIIIIIILTHIFVVKVLLNFGRFGTENFQNP